MPASCANKTKDGDETDVDCGGKFCVPCALGAKCKDASDCVTKGCSNGVCSTCADELLNGDETDTNCGGSCPPCPDAHVCKVDAECSTGGCVAGVCHLLPRCHDGKLNDDEVDVDCGGKTCLRCADGKKCKLGDDCLSGKCVNGTCGKFTCQCPMNPYGLHCRQDGTCACDGRSCDDCCEGHTKCGGYNGIDQLCGRYGKFCTQCGPIFSGCFHGIYRTYCWNQLGPLCKTGCCVGTWCYPSNTVEHCGGAICQTCKQGMMCQAGACK
ncbi:MAG: hypothetical protein EXR72_18255 [Myxococcales bacterium]|nr:hypothetical protein [Myxococcales bacterium]